MRRLAWILLVVGILCVPCFLYVMIAQVDINPAYFVPFVIVMVLSLLTSPALLAFHLPLKRRRKIANRILIGVFCIVLSACLFIWRRWPSAGIQLILGIFLFCFTYGTLALKNKYEKWKEYSRSKFTAFLFSLFDFLGTGFLFLGLLFKLQHWPASVELMIAGAVVLAVSMLAWNQKFKTEVVFRKNAEDQLQLQKLKLEEKQKEITDSITYAKRIQQSLLAHDSQLQKGLQDFFVLYLPKDIVSGDFYWCTETPDSFYLAVCDSTGHGVPGAFMSLLNISFLNEAITEKKIAEPNLILDHTRNQLISNLSQNDSQDGMDGILVRFEKQNRRITYSAANNAPVIVSNGVAMELPVDKMPIGKGEKQTPFALHEIAVKQGDLLYLTTDGFADQFGGDKGKKFKRSGLKELMLQLTAVPLNAQSERFANEFNKWKGELDQVDDVLIVGIRF